jgi:hypothetical protein
MILFYFIYFLRSNMDFYKDPHNLEQIIPMDIINSITDEYLITPEHLSDIDNIHTTNMTNKNDKLTNNNVLTDPFNKNLDNLYLQFQKINTDKLDHNDSKNNFKQFNDSRYKHIFERINELQKELGTNYLGPKRGRARQKQMRQLNSKQKNAESEIKLLKNRIAARKNRFNKKNNWEKLSKKNKYLNEKNKKYETLINNLFTMIKNK